MLTGTLSDVLLVMKSSVQMSVQMVSRSWRMPAASYSQNFIEHGIGIVAGPAAAADRCGQIIESGRSASFKHRFLTGHEVRREASAAAAAAAGTAATVLVGQSSKTHIDVWQECTEPVLPVFARHLVLLLHRHVSELLLELVKGVSATSTSPTVRPTPVDQI